MQAQRKARIHALLKGIETGDPAAVAVVHPTRYVQHNPQTREGGEGLAALFKRLSATSPRVNIVRLFSDGDFVFGQTEYAFSTDRVGFEVFRFEGDHAVEHWDNIQSRAGPNASGHSMVDGPAEASGRDRTEANRTLVAGFAAAVLVGRDFGRLPEFVAEGLVEHSPHAADGLAALAAALAETGSDGNPLLIYDRQHRVLADGNFVLSVCEGWRFGHHTAFYDLFRIEHGLIAEHWGTMEKVPPPSEWQNANGKF